MGSRAGWDGFFSNDHGIVPTLLTMEPKTDHGASETNHRAPKTDCRAETNLEATGNNPGAPKTIKSPETDPGAHGTDPGDLVTNHRVPETDC